MRVICCKLFGRVEVLDFAYDAQGIPYSLTYTNSTASPVTYYYITNLQGDVMYLINSSGTKVATYSYDPYGKVASATGTMADINPLRYRGYCTDSETGFYYLQSRYYDPTVCRFINADTFASTSQEFTGYNMFTYCNNNPVMGNDPTGEWPDWNKVWKVAVSVGEIAVGAVLVATGAGGIVGGTLIAGGACSLIGGFANEATEGSFTAGWIGGQVGGVFTGTGIGVGAMFYEAATISSAGYALSGTFLTGTLCFTGGAVSSAITQQIDSGTINGVKVLTNGMINAIVSILAVPFANIADTLASVAPPLGAVAAITVEATFDYINYKTGRIIEER